MGTVDFDSSDTADGRNPPGQPVASAKPMLTAEYHATQSVTPCWKPSQTPVSQNRSPGEQWWAAPSPCRASPLSARTDRRTTQRRGRSSTGHLVPHGFTAIEKVVIMPSAGSATRSRTTHMLLSQVRRDRQTGPLASYDHHGGAHYLPTSDGQHILAHGSARNAHPVGRVPRNPHGVLRPARPRQGDGGAGRLRARCIAASLRGWASRPLMRGP
ncbi:MAG: hypothetical protein JWN03_6498 [Nocardia sp.]|nr:hypothetical protein [Nocardia sp.]